MPKIFTEAEKDRHREVLFDKGFRLISERGYKNVKVDQLVELIEASKGYFYTLFDSKEEYFLGAIAWQMEREYDRLKEAKDAGASDEEVRILYREIFLESRFSNYIDMIEIREKAGEELWERFRTFELRFFEKVTALLCRGRRKPDPKVLSNLSAMIFLSYGMLSYAPYLFKERNRETVEILLDTMHRYAIGEK
ncbi:MAG TPA: TetR/AcrR family transcriptional regulator [Candidatus Avanaerovorax faecigallinarum]|nr:TetR/AcrR family transcriptional regulator [Candidatus Avanaerovorax faecigallinarum]